MPFATAARQRALTRLRIVPERGRDPRALALVLALMAPMALGGPAAAQDPVIAAAGDIACQPSDPGYNGGAGTSTRCRQRATSDLLVGAGLNAVLPLGDIQYDSASTAEIMQVYHPTWGRVKSISRPVIGNHEGGGGGYFDYFNGTGAADGPAGPRGKGWYSFNVGNWHLVALNSNCTRVGCTAGSEQEQWLRADLAAHTGSCILAYSHHARYSSGHDGNNTVLQPLWEALDDAGAELLLSGHSHNYERIAPLDRIGNRNDANGIRQFVVGTGGAFFTGGLDTLIPHSQAAQNDTFGVLFVTLHSSSYSWQFVPEAGRTWTDSGATACRGAAPPPPPPPSPTLTGTDPASPANQNAPRVKGSAAAGSTVRLYTHPACSGTPVASGSAAAFSSTGLTVSVANNSSTTFYATATSAAGGTSPCSSTSATYVEDSTAPGPPTLTDTDPDSPANLNTPMVKGIAEAGSTVRLFTTAACSGNVAATGSAAAFAAPGLPVSVADNSSTRFYATATDAAGNASACSSSFITYVENSSLPPPPPTGGGGGGSAGGGCPPTGCLVTEALVIPPADTTAPGVALTGRTSQRLGATVGVTVRATTEDLWVTASASVSVPGASKIFRLKPVRNRMVARGTTATLKLKLSKSARKAIKRALRRGATIHVRLKLNLRDRAGNAATRTRTIRLSL